MTEFNADQRQALQKIDAFLEQGFQREFHLFGYAGTGKTTCAIELQNAYPNKQFLFLAYTGKACNVLRTKGALNVCTLHSFFKKAQTIDSGITAWARAKIAEMDTGMDYKALTEINNDVNYWRFLKYHFIFGHKDSLLKALLACADKTNKTFNKTGGVLFLPVEAANYLGETVLIIDECSMLSQYEWRPDIDAFLEKNPYLKIIYIGDPAQLPPIIPKGQPNQAPLCKPDKADYILTKIMRQGEGSNILQVASAIKEPRTEKFDIANYKNLVFVKNKTSDLGAKMELLFSRSDIVLAYRRKTVSAINAYMRQILGYRAPLPQEGEPILITKNIKIALPNLETKLNNGEIHTCIDDAVLMDRSALTQSDVSPVIARLREDILVKKFFQEHSGRDGCIVISLDLSGIIVNLPVSAPCFYSKYPITNAYWAAAQADYGYCLTVHKAQGSEWDKVVIIDEAFGWGFLPALDYNRWLYTAITRAAKSLAVFRHFSTMA